VFSIFATLAVVEFKLFGVTMAVAVLLDATVVRGVLLPAGLALLGDRAWWFPWGRPRGLAGPAGGRHAGRRQAVYAGYTTSDNAAGSSSLGQAGTMIG